MERNIGKIEANKEKKSRREIILSGNVCPKGLITNRHETFNAR